MTTNQTAQNNIEVITDDETISITGSATTDQTPDWSWHDPSLTTASIAQSVYSVDNSMISLNPSYTMDTSNSPIMSIGAAGDGNAKLQLNGKNADIEINGVSLNKTLSAINERLNILSVNKDLEGKWEELKELGDKYRQLESEIIEKQKFWDLLKK